VPNLKFLASTVREILGGSQNSNIGSRVPHMTPFDEILHFFRWKSPPSVCVPNLNFLASIVREIWGGSQNSKIGSRVPHMTSFGPILHFFPFELTALRLRAKFEVSSYNRPRNIRGVPKFQNWVRWLPHDRFSRNFECISLELTAVRLRAKFEVSSFNRSRDIRGSQNSKIGLGDSDMTPFHPILNVFR